jgi:protein-S-isoprenylcysteine O-methyltransferase Ste14
MEGPQLNAFAIAQIVAVAALLWIVFTRPEPWDLQRYAGAALVVVGVAGIAAARYQLGKSFSLKPIVAMQTLRARREAQVLEAAFGDCYRDYRRKTWFSRKF